MMSPKQYLQQHEISATNIQGLSLDGMTIFNTLFQLKIFVYNLQEIEKGEVVAKLV